MDDETKRFAMLCASCVLAILILSAASVGGCRACEETNQCMAAHGYVETPNVGSTGTHWEKK